MTVETESFTAGNGTAITSVGSGIWAITIGASDQLFVTSNEIRHKVNTNSMAVATRAGTFTDNQYAQIKITSLSVSQSRIGVVVRGSGGDAYFLYIDSSLYALGKMTNYVYSELRVASHTCSVGDVLRLEVEGTTLRAMKNGVAFWTATDSSFASGNPGVSGNGQNPTNFNAGDDWEGGDLVATALQNWQYDWPHQLHARR